MHYADKIETLIVTACGAYSDHCVVKGSMKFEVRTFRQGNRAMLRIFLLHFHPAQ